MAKTELCPHCNDFQTYSRGSSFQDLYVRGEYVKMRLEYCRCEKCDNVYSTKEQFEKAKLEAHRNYQKKHKLYQAEDFRAFREYLGLNNLEFANLFAWAKSTVYKYQKGFLQTRAHNRIFQILQNPNILKRILTEKHIHLPEEKIANIIKLCNKKIKDEK